MDSEEASLEGTGAASGLVAGDGGSEVGRGQNGRASSDTSDLYAQTLRECFTGPLCMCLLASEIGLV